MKKIFIIYTILLWMPYCFAQDAVVDSLNVPQEEQLAEFVPPAEPDITKAQADSAYMNNDYVAAIQIYEALLNKGEATELYYNLGNSYYKSGNIAKAILNYERALLLSPGNDDIRANLKIAQGKTVDKVDEVPDIFFVSWIKSLINSTSIGAWAVWGIVFFILFIATLFVYFFSKNATLKKVGFFAGLAMLVCVVCVNIFASYQKSTLENRKTAIIMSPSITVRSTPNENGTSLFVLHEGHKVVIKDNSMNAWKEIQLENGNVGWVMASDIEII